MPASEIDDIFAASKEGATAKSAPQPSTSQAPEKEKQKKKSVKKRKRGAEGKSTADESESAEQPAKKRVPETVVDPSLQLAASLKKRSKQPKPEQLTETKNKPKVDREEEERFKDSRGTGPRRKTEDGFLIFKEDELGINAESGGTPLCPFDCQCCF
ncbi:uncharacterized protein PHACADRAFT_24178 [Phanerochaete carnosa HHB-10118-sp]|uniref:DUF1764-domain-containing protein n=1 Tax=Phanerochaete carnosa (strain HHB-10118-sp) TaxID=650164 RepID=K5WND4_PHACS|nr:uncharacterized protein PHACADRAFT_24178 [Phanerochaete carnosa HHB-10118-sp]EKM60950.1 hypothetical protein PHACADRAFT_24178 [Phanerochaete carnosa HHB-10118-sp]